MRILVMPITQAGLISILEIVLVLVYVLLIDYSFKKLHAMEIIFDENVNPKIKKLVLHVFEEIKNDTFSEEELYSDENVSMTILGDSSLVFNNEGVLTNSEEEFEVALTKRLIKTIIIKEIHKEYPGMLQNLLPYQWEFKFF